MQQCKHMKTITIETPKLHEKNNRKAFLRDFSVIIPHSEINIPSLKLSPCSPFFVILIDLAVVHIAKQHKF